MKTATQAAASLLSLGVLLAAASSHATTDIATLPLKASVLAKPNVIFGLDDSGSMDSELMLYNNDGAFWWDFDNAKGWGTDGSHPNTALRTIVAGLFNNAGDATSRWRKMIYLFPNGNGTGERQYSDASNDHFAVLPTTQFATLRWSGIYYDTKTGSYKSAPSDPAASPMHNPIYYNPLVTYEPWAPAQLSTGAIAPAAAAPKAVKSHPIRGNSTFDLTANVAASTSDHKVFTAFPGMRIPAGSQKKVCKSDNTGCSDWTNVANEEAAAASKVTRVSMAYYAATYWVREACTVPASPNVATDSCTYLPGSDTVTLKRYEIKNGNTFPSGRSYDDELKNFANWFQYYRKRRLMLAGAMGETMENLTGMRLGVQAFYPVEANTAGNVTMYDADAAAAASNRLRVAGMFYEVANGSGTPTRKVLDAIGKQFQRTDKTGNNYNVVQYACQRNSAFIVTDGFANNDTVTPPKWDKDKTADTFGGIAPYAADFDKTHTGTLADLALRYYTNNPRIDFAIGQLPATPRDRNIDLHMNTYGLTLGARGTLFLGEDSTAPTTTSAWPDPNTNRNPTSVDDLWRATLSGRGKMYLATTPAETALRIQAGLNDILSQTGAQGGIAVSTVNLRNNDMAYFGTYNPAGWAGDLTGNKIDPQTGAISEPSWWASKELAARNWKDRVIATSVGGVGASFTKDNDNVKNAVNPGAKYGSDTAVFNYLRGDRSGEGTVFRSRTSLMGAVISSEPVVSRDDKVVYVASGEGMLHAFDITAGKEGQELWAFVPGQALPDIGETVQRGYTFRTHYDGSPVLGKFSASGKLLVSGMGAAGRGYFALDVSYPRGPDNAGLNDAGLAGKLKWEFPGADDATKVGQTLGRPVIVKTDEDGYVVLLTSGYNSTVDGKGRLWMLNADTGAVIKEFTVNAGTLGAEAGLAHVVAFGESSGTVRYVYGGDLLGNVWRFDLTKKGDPVKVATLVGPSGEPQPVTAAPEVMNLNGKRVLFVGTGRLLDIKDFGNSNVQSIYAIADSADGPTLVNARTSLAKQTYDRSKDTLTGEKVDWSKQRGWYMDLPAGEQINTRPTLAYDGLAFVSNLNGATDCTAKSYLYVVNAESGQKFEGADFIGTLLSDKSNSSGVTALLTTGQKIVGTGQDADGKPWERDLTSGPPLKPGKNAWMEVRRR